MQFRAFTVTMFLGATLRINMRTPRAARLRALRFSSIDAAKVTPPSPRYARNVAWTLLGSGAVGVGYLGWAESHGNRQIVGLSDEGLPRTYQPGEIQEYWDKHPNIALARVVTIGCTILPFLSRLLSTNYLTSDMENESVKQDYAIEFRHLLTKLGPTFIKFGQMLSIRPDVLPPIAVYELQKLCDSVPAFPTRTAIQMVEKELGISDVTSVLDGLEEDAIPIAAASLGQVYKCRIKATGETIALKVQRPDMLRAVSLDLYLLRKYAHFVEGFKSYLMEKGLFAKRKSYDVELLDTFASASYLELDYVKEGTNQEFVQEHLVPKIGKDKMHVPSVFWKFTSRKVLASEFINGIQLAKSDKDTIRRLIPVGVKIYLTQLLDIGFFHSDPHPGNLLVDEYGRLVLIDFGLCATVAQPDTKGMTSAIVHLMTGDVDNLVTDAIHLGFLPSDVDRNNLLPVLQRVFDEAKLKDEIKNSLLNGAGGAVSYRSVERRKRFGAISKDLNSIFFEFPFTVPNYFALITRALIVLEGIALTGDPQFDIFRASYPYARSRAIHVFGFKNTAKILGAQMAME